MRFKIFKGKNIVHGISEVSFGSMRGKRGDKNATRFLKALGHKANIKNLVWTEQVFGSMIHICKDTDSGRTIKGADGLISDIPGQILAIVSADCVPILLFDQKNKAVAALHGSRSSLVMGIVRRTISKMVLNFHSQPEEILVAIGPHIRKCHYWLKKQTYQNLKNTKFKKYFISKNKKIYFDLTKLSFDKLLDSGIKRKNIEDCQICTFYHFKKYFSARKEKQNPKIYSDSKNIRSSPPFAAARVRNPRFASFIGFQTPQSLRVLDRKSNGFIKKAAESIKKGEILVCPTDTVYGLIADAANKKAVKRLFKIKKRNPRKPVPIFVKDIKMAKKLVYINKNQEKFIKKVWPGKVTVVLKRKKGQNLYGLDRKTIAIRIPNHRFLNILLKKINRPLTGTSANISGKPTSTKIKEILRQFKNQLPATGGGVQPDLIIDAGNLPKNRPSKVIDLTGKKIKILRK